MLAGEAGKEKICKLKSLPSVIPLFFEEEGGGRLRRKLKPKYKCLRKYYFHLLLRKQASDAKHR